MMNEIARATAMEETKVSPEVAHDEGLESYREMTHRQHTRHTSNNPLQMPMQDQQSTAENNLDDL